MRFTMCWRAESRSPFRPMRAPRASCSSSSAPTTLRRLVSPVSMLTATENPMCCMSCSSSRFPASSAAGDASAAWSSSRSRTSDRALWTSSASLEESADAPGRSAGLRGGRSSRRGARSSRRGPRSRVRSGRSSRRDDRPERTRDRGPRRDDRAPRRDDRPPRRPAERPGASALSSSEADEVQSARSLVREREELQAAEASPAALDAGKRLLEQLMQHLGFSVAVNIETGETNRLNVVGADDEEHEALGALIGRKGERLSALQHIVNLMLSREMGEWTRVLVDVEGYRGRRELQLREIADRAAARVIETGKMLQLAAAAVALDVDEDAG